MIHQPQMLIKAKLQEGRTHHTFDEYNIALTNLQDFIPAGCLVRLVCCCLFTGRRENRMLVHMTYITV